MPSKRKAALVTGANRGIEFETAASLFEGGRIEGDQHFKVHSAHPGWVKTDWGTQHAQLEVADGAKTGVDLALVGPKDLMATSFTQARKCR